MSRWSANRMSVRASALGAAVAIVVATAAYVLPASSAPATTTISVKVSPDRGLVNGQVVTVNGHGLTHTAGGSGLTWFVTQCTAAVHGRVHPATDTPNCDVADAKAIRVGRDGTFSTKFPVRAGIVGDGYCGTAGHPTCVIGVSTAKGQGTVVKISFASRTIPTTSTTAG